MSVSAASTISINGASQPATGTIQVPPGQTCTIALVTPPMPPISGGAANARVTIVTSYGPDDREVVTMVPGPWSVDVYIPMVPAVITYTVDASDGVSAARTSFAVLVAAAGGITAPTPAALSALAPGSPYPAGTIAQVAAPSATWQLVTGSTLTPDGVTVVASSSAAGGGNWVLARGSIAGAITASYTMQTTDTLVKVAAGAKVTFPAAPSPNVDYVIRVVSGTAETSPVQLSGNGYNIEDPGAAALYTYAATGTIKTSGSSTRWRWDGTNMVLT